MKVMKTTTYYVPIIACLICVVCLVSFGLGRWSISDGELKQPLDKTVAGKAINDLQSDKERRKVNLNLKQETAIKIAEVILCSIYGEKVLKQRPWKVTETETAFIIKGTLHGGNGYTKDGVKMFVLGGVAEIIINKSDARVIKYAHGA